MSPYDKGFRRRGCLSISRWRYCPHSCKDARRSCRGYGNTTIYHHCSYVHIHLTVIRNTSNSVQFIGTVNRWWNFSSCHLEIFINVVFAKRIKNWLLDCSTEITISEHHFYEGLRHNFHNTKTRKYQLQCCQPNSLFGAQIIIIICACKNDVPPNILKKGLMFLEECDVRVDLFDNRSTFTLTSDPDSNL